MAAYPEKLRDPRWQKKRLEILQRDGWKCQMCDGKDETLIVHHRYYLRNIEPWDYPNSSLITLCEECHEMESINSNSVNTALLEILHSLFMSEDIHTLKLGFHRLQHIQSARLTAETLSWAMSYPKVMKDLFMSYTKHNKES